MRIRIKIISRTNGIDIEYPFRWSERHGRLPMGTSRWQPTRMCNQILDGGPRIAIRAGDDQGLLTSAVPWGLARDFLEFLGHEFFSHTSQRWTGTAASTSKPRRTVPPLISSTVTLSRWLKALDSP